MQVGPQEREQRPVALGEIPAVPAERPGGWFARLGVCRFSSSLTGWKQSNIKALFKLPPKSKGLLTLPQ